MIESPGHAKATHARPSPLAVHGPGYIHRPFYLRVIFIFDVTTLEQRAPVLSMEKNSNRQRQFLLVLPGRNGVLRQCASSYLCYLSYPLAIAMKSQPACARCIAAYRPTRRQLLSHTRSADDVQGALRLHSASNGVGEARAVPAAAVQEYAASVGASLCVASARTGAGVQVCLGFRSWLRVY